MLFFTLFIVVLAFILIGNFANHATQQQANNYLLAQRQVSASMTALSAAASKYSGYMFVGLIGFIYIKGLLAVWIILGFLLGDLIAWLFVIKKLHLISQESNALTYASLISNWQGYEQPILRKVIALTSLVFLTMYAAAQLTAAGKTLHSIIDWPVELGTIISGLVIAIYSAKGGLRASIWTDVLQAMLMMLALILVVYFCFQPVGGINGLIGHLHSLPNHLDLGVKRLGSIYAVIGFAVGWIFNGIGTLGQPHIMIRYMALDSQANLKTTAIIYFIWSLIFVVLILLTGLMCAVLLNNIPVSDAEHALPLLAQQYMPPSLLALVLAGILSSIISTADSQILSCSAVLTEDLNLGQKPQKRQLMSLFVIIVAICISTLALTDVFTLVVFTWSALASGFAPLIILLTFKQSIGQTLGITMIVIGIMVSITWRMSGLSEQIYEAFPGICASFIVWLLIKGIQKIPVR